MNISQFLDTHSIVYLKVSTWSATRNNKPKDLGLDGQQIAAECASLGGKSVFDRKKLKFMHQHRADAMALLNKYGFPCMGGYAIQHCFKDAVVNGLQALKESNDNKLEALLADYSAECESWITEAEKKVTIPGFADAIRASLYTESYVRNQVRFEFHVNDNMAEDPVGDVVLNTIAELAEQSLNTFQASMANGSNFTRKSLSYLMKVKEKLIQVSMLDSFVTPAITQIEKFEEEWNRVGSQPRKVNGKTSYQIDPSMMNLLMGELSLLANPKYLDSLRNATLTIEDEPIEDEPATSNSLDEQPDDFLAGLLALTGAPAPEQEGATLSFY